MAPISLVPTPSTADYKLGTTINDYTSNNEDSVNNIDISEINSKIVFFRFMGLEIKKVSDNRKTDKTCDNDKSDKFDKLQRNARRSIELSSETISCDTFVDNLNMRSTINRETNKRTNHSDNMIDSHKNNKRIRECSVMIIGEMCRSCGRSFKCITDLEIHMKKRHKSNKKPRKKHVVLKIGDEVMARLPIRNKHLKRAYRESDSKILNDDVATLTASYIKEIDENDRINSERLETPLINVEDICDIAKTTTTHRNKIYDCDVRLSTTLRDRTKIPSNRCDEDNDDEEIKEVLRIRRSPKFAPSINHETPNRLERELLLSDAIREFDRLDNDPIDIFKLTENDKSSRHVTDDFIEDFCWLADGNLRNNDLDLIENNCSFNISDDYDIDDTSRGAVSVIEELNNKYFRDENIYCKEYRKANGDIIPDYIDYTQCLNDNYSRLSNNNNKSNIDVCNIESSFYNEVQMSEWNQLTKASKTFSAKVPRRSKTTNNLPIFIKEEIILDDTH